MEIDTTMILSGRIPTTLDSQSIQSDTEASEDYMDSLLYYGPSYPPYMDSRPQLHPPQPTTSAVPVAQRIYQARGGAGETPLDPAIDVGLDDERLGAVLWTRNERQNALEGFMRFGRSFADVARVVQTKTEAQCRYFFYHYRTTRGAMVSELVAEPAVSAVTKPAKPVLATPTSSIGLNLSLPTTSLPKPATSSPSLSLSLPVIPDTSNSVDTSNPVDTTNPVDDTVPENKDNDDSANATSPVKPLSKHIDNDNDDEDSSSVPLALRLSNFSTDSKPSIEPVLQLPTPTSQPVESATDNSTEKNPKKPIFSSYWSVQERATFLSLLPTMGDNWQQLSSALGTKTPIQVRNYYRSHRQKLGLDSILLEYQNSHKPLQSSSSQSTPLIAAAQLLLAEDGHVKKKRKTKKRSIDRSNPDIVLLQQQQQQYQQQQQQQKQKQKQKQKKVQEQEQEQEQEQDQHVQELEQEPEQEPDQEPDQEQEQEQEQEHEQDQTNSFGGGPSLAISGGHAFVVTSQHPHLRRPSSSSISSSLSGAQHSSTHPQINSLASESSQPTPPPLDSLPPMLPSSPAELHRPSITNISSLLNAPADDSANHSPPYHYPDIDNTSHLYQQQLQQQLQQQQQLQPQYQQQLQQQLHHHHQQQQQQQQQQHYRYPSHRSLSGLESLVHAATSIDAASSSPYQPPHSYQYPPLIQQHQTKKKGQKISSFSSLIIY
ncbi:Nuclear receptor corepressor 1 [Zancudomyces culisetae]|uniref:Nuclear receptor corepressor 1 n=1 Tax=Zancudomyces culisetae TaxID=1213189 RepID=A0A1R1PTH1_ZANCU|nr:Nuclear receptor corepressor 1 [Zancudomyces culisetae]|eukprot:OMH84203.1 Nuclear receptor corepressor 1 [Zancudomyces culisetae]